MTLNDLERRIDRQRTLFLTWLSFLLSAVVLSVRTQLSMGHKNRPLRLCSFTCICTCL